MKISTLCSMDSQGRIVIPALIRKSLRLQTGDSLEIKCSDSIISLQKTTAFIPNVEQCNIFLNILHDVISCSAFICTTECVIAQRGIAFPKGFHIPTALEKYLLQNQEIILSPTDNVLVAQHLKDPVNAIFPIRTHNSHSPFMALVLLSKNRKPLTDMELGSAKLVAATLQKQL